MRWQPLPENKQFLSPTRLSSSQNRQRLLFLSVSLVPRMLRETEQTVNKCWMNNLNYSGRSGRQYFTIMSFYLPVSFSCWSGQSVQRELEEHWSHGTDSHTHRVGPVPSHFPKYTSFSKFRKTSSQRVEFPAFSPSCSMTHYLPQVVSSQLGRRVMREADHWKHGSCTKREGVDSEWYL